MTNREKEILKLLKDNPMISQKELADELGITRSSVAVHITNLTKKGIIAGKGYILNDEPYAVVVGGCNMDIQGAPMKLLKMNDSNPGVVNTSLGGVGRNICENISRLGIKSGLISIVGDDVYGNKILDQARSLSIDIKGVAKLPNKSTSTYLSVLDESGDMAVAIAHMDIIDQLTVEYVKNFADYIKNARYCVIDTNIPKEVIQYLLDNFQCDFILDCVSTTKAMKVSDCIGKFHTIKPNRMEAEILSGMQIKNFQDVKKCAELFLGRGVKNVFISMGADGVYYSNGNESGLIGAKDVKVVNATGAGDAFIAGVTFAYMNDLSIEECVKSGIAASVLALESDNTINEKLSRDTLSERLNKLNFMNGEK